MEGENEAGEQTLEVVFYVSVESEDGAPVYIPEEDLEDVFVEHGDEIADETGGETVSATTFVRHLTWEHFIIHVHCQQLT